MANRRQIKLSSGMEIRRGLSRIANMVLNDELDPKQANSIIGACNSMLGAIRVDDQEKKLAELEALIRARDA